MSELDAAGRELLSRVANLNVDKGGGQRKPHKPLLLLYAIARLIRFREWEIPFQEVRAALTPLLELYAPPVVSRHQPELPYWHLRSDGVWEVPGAESLPLQAGGFPRAEGLRQTHGRIPQRFSQLLITMPGLARRVVSLILDEHFESSLHEDILAAVGLEPEFLLTGRMGIVPDTEPTGDRETAARLRRSAAFRDEVLAAYDRRCALTGFQAMIAGTLFGVEAAHVHWHSKGGPSCVANGIALNPTMHKLFDHGAWTLDDDRRVIVSREFSGSDAAIETLRPLHGRRLRDPLPGCEPVAIDHLRWHRLPELGGIFRWPALPLS